MNVDETLRASVVRIGRSVEPPVPDVMEIRRRARRGQQRRALVGLAAVAAVAAFVGGGFWYVGEQGNYPTPADPSPDRGSAEVPERESPAGAVWYTDGVLHDDQESFTISPRPATNLAVVKHGVLFGDGSDAVIYQRQDGSTETLGDNAPLGPAGDPTSDLAVWFEARGRAVEIVVYDVGTDQELARTDLGALDVQTPESMVGTDQPPVLWVGDGQSGGPAVYFRAEESVWRYDWTSGADPRRVRGEFARALDVGGDVWALSGPHQRGITFKSSDGTELSTNASVEPDGSLSHDGRLYIGYSRRGTVVIDTATGKARLLHLGSHRLVMGMTWARDGTAIMLAPDVTSDGRGGSIIACDANSLQCQTSKHIDNLLTAALPNF